ncbi:XRE family transcriptional regulator [Clostridium carboxidivorans P7]|uniref:Cyclic nucleotide-binding protein n=1 Tax=Clostridium carboxidivorans P7 TaxID=536227 RepID=C6Q2B7_9CLOT|nr:transcriptional regulator YeiL [Clostridium carboxidivorans]AKN30384.1 XRE family transcriptional regulator [Clostridium carboxidivorans P7]EET84357.1 cyclic nucleotide-binding protein [Clostridium carboxidivorans P7]
MKYHDRNLLMSYLKEYPIQQYFSLNILPFLSLVEFDDGDFIYKEDSLPSYLFYMIKGNAKLYLTHKNGKVSLINFLKAPCFIGEMELIKAQQCTNEVQALCNCICFSFDISKCSKLLLDDKVFLKYLCFFLSKKAIENTTNYTQNQAYPLKNRLASFILLTNSNGLYVEKHSEVCEYLGVSYRHLLYVIADFCKSGILKKTTNGYKIINMKLLNKIAKN